MKGLNGSVTSSDGYTIIEPPQKKVPLGLGELWQQRELLFFFVWRDVKVRYKQTVLGAAWAILQPLMAMVIFSLFFGKLAKMPSDGIPYPIFSYAALVPWTYFAGSISRGSVSLIGNQGLLKKIYFPRLALPISSVLAGLVDFALAFLVLLVMMAYYGFAPTLNVIWLPFLILLACLTALGVSLSLASLCVKFRDVRYIVPFMVQAWLFLTPIVYPSSLIEVGWAKALYALNPMVGVVEGFRWALLGTDTAPGPMVIISTAVTGLVLWFGLRHFKRVEETFADVA